MNKIIFKKPIPPRRESNEVTQIRNACKENNIRLFSESEVTELGDIGHGAFGKCVKGKINSGNFFLNFFYHY